MRNHSLSFALVAMLLSAGCVESDGGNNNSEPLPSTFWVDHMIESVTVDASENTVTVFGVFRPSPDYAQECAPYCLGASEIVHVIALYPDAEDYRPGVWQYSDATPISAEEFEARAEAARLNEFDVPIQLNGIERIRTSSVYRLSQEFLEHLYSGTHCADLIVDYTNGTHAPLRLFCGACTERGACGDAWCDSGEETSCWQDCPAPLGESCGDGWCAPTEIEVCPTDCSQSP
ncbi:MAG: hypothetical protein RBU30_01740 [Polyangia bacterium]|jgi:hypothetical protein|nr:hypothetical protein [Polyangia bacterium]